MSSKIIIIIVFVLVLALLAVSFVVFSQINAEIDDFVGSSEGSASTDEDENTNTPSGGSTSNPNTDVPSSFPVDESSEASRNLFTGVIGTYDGVDMDLVNDPGPYGKDVLHTDVITNYDGTVMVINSDTTGWVSDVVGKVEYDGGVSFFYRELYFDGTWGTLYRAEELFTIYVLGSDGVTWSTDPTGQYAAPGWVSTSVRIGVSSEINSLKGKTFVLYALSY